AKPAEAKIAANDPAILNSALKILAKQGGTWANGVEIVFADTLAGDVASASYDGVARRLTIDIDSANTTAQTLVDAVNLEGTFSAELDLESDPSNDGSGVPGRTGSVAFLDGGTAEVLSGRDVNMAEVSSVFNSLQKLMDALSGEVDYVEAERAYALLEEDFDRINHIRAELGAQTRAVDVLTTRLEEETVLLRTTLSEEIDADLVEAVSNLTLQQTAYQASLQMIGQSFQLTLLNFL
ncbi:MAG: flagellin, partial [Planctomycetota bacterium]|nr:flagellin [Planctomycetota bacterium]